MSLPPSYEVPTAQREKVTEGKRMTNIAPMHQWTK